MECSVCLGNQTIFVTSILISHSSLRTFKFTGFSTSVLYVALFGSPVCTHYRPILCLKFFCVTFIYCMDCFSSLIFPCLLSWTLLFPFFLSQMDQMQESRCVGCRNALASKQKVKLARLSRISIYHTSE